MLILQQLMAFKGFQDGLHRQRRFSLAQQLQAANPCRLLLDLVAFLPYNFADDQTVAVIAQFAMVLTLV